MSNRISTSGPQLRTAAALKQEVARCSEILKVKPSQVRIQNMTRKWASCSTTGWITLTEDLLDMPRRFQQVVIVHELLHLQIPNHGKLFRSMMNALLPGWEEVLRKQDDSREI